ncbi:MAG: hypothetical protein WAV41_04900 [Microgenomates group bacterium]
MSEFISTLHSKKLFGEYGFAIISISGTEPILARHSSQVTYSVLEGYVDITTETETRHLTHGEKITLEPHTYYRKSGTAKIIARDLPPFDEASLEYKTN